LHASRVVHRDLASRNVLLRLSPLTAQVSDFGMSRIVDDDVGQTMTLAGPIKWQAPEQFRGTPSLYSFSTDVFSFAVLLTELVGNRLPWPDISNVQAAVAVTKGARTVVPERMMPRLRDVVEKCWEQQADKRPTMAEVVAMLEREPLSAVADEGEPPRGRYVQHARDFYVVPSGPRYDAMPSVQDEW
jgi:serine/threonine protein kinase